MGIRNRKTAISKPIINVIPNNQAARNVLLALVLLVVMGFCLLLWLSIKNHGENELDKRFYDRLHNSPYW